jgi:SRSO17 transposase
MVATGVPSAWVLGDAVYGSDKTLRVSLEERDNPYVLAVRGNEKLTAGDFHIQPNSWPPISRHMNGSVYPPA